MKSTTMWVITCTSFIDTSCSAMVSCEYVLFASINSCMVVAALVVVAVPSQFFVFVIYCWLFCVVLLMIIFLPCGCALGLLHCVLVLFSSMLLCLCAHFALADQILGYFVWL